MNICLTRNTTQMRPETCFNPLMPYCNNLCLCCFRFRSAMVKEMIHIVLNEHLSDKEYNTKETRDLLQSFDALL